MEATARRGKRDTLIDVTGTYGARVTSVAGSWGFWSNGKRTAPFETREQAEDAALAYLEAQVVARSDGAS